MILFPDIILADANLIYLSRLLLQTTLPCLQGIVQVLTHFETLFVNGQSRAREADLARYEKLLDKVRSSLRLASNRSNGHFEPTAGRCSHCPQEIEVSGFVTLYCREVDT
jgi:hypothetical protein